MKPIILYTRHTCPAKTLLVPYGEPVVTLNGDLLFFEDGRPVLLENLEDGCAHEVKIK